MGAFLTVDFAKAYDSVQHTYMVAALEYLGVDRALVALLIQLFRAPFIFAVGRGVVSGRVTRSRRHCLSFSVPRLLVSYKRSLRSWSFAYMLMTYWFIRRLCHVQLCV